jgi:hypothetical protein
MKKLVTLLVLSTLITGCQNGEVNAIDSAPFSGTINQSDEKSEAVRKFAKAIKMELLKSQENTLHPTVNIILII